MQPATLQSPRRGLLPPLHQIGALRVGVAMSRAMPLAVIASVAVHGALVAVLGQFPGSSDVHAPLAAAPAFMEIDTIPEPDAPPEPAPAEPEAQPDPAAPEPPAQAAVNVAPPRLPPEPAAPEPPVEPPEPEPAVAAAAEPEAPDPTVAAAAELEAPEPKMAEPAETATAAVPEPSKNVAATASEPGRVPGAGAAGRQHGRAAGRRVGHRAGAARGTVVRRGPSAADRRRAQRRYVHSLEGLIRAHTRYPRAAARAGLEGRVVLALRIARNGHLVGLRVASTSGHDLLDDAALDAARAIGQLPPPPRLAALDSSDEVRVGVVYVVR